MKRFAFRLERLRELRERAEREQAAVLGTAMRSEREHEEALERARRDVERARAGKAELARSAPQAAGLLHNLERVRDTALERADAAAADLRTASERVEEERTRYHERRRDVRVLERLKQKRLEAWRDESAREEQKETDGVARRRTTTGEPQ